MTKKKESRVVMGGDEKPGARQEEIQENKVLTHRTPHPSLSAPWESSGFLK